MVAKRKTKTEKTHEMIDTKTEDLMISPTPRVRNTRWAWGLIVLLVVAGGAFLFRKGYIVAATVNGTPIYRWQLTNMMMSRYGQQTLESMVTEQLIADAAKKDGIALTKEEIDAKVNEIVSTLGPNVNLEDLLKYQGMTKADFEEQIRLQLTVERILGKDVAVTDEEIDTYIAENKSTMTATEAGAMKEEAKTSLTSQKISEKIQPWLTELKSKATITKLLQ